ncbi:MAG TPA: SagB/ThcOx family dehydrogenase [Candidatus Woesearchaeota archaeon]|nr:SagB/ThcOx family dehydrogenase [Candidatus Woesearchaeota archaeon]
MASKSPPEIIKIGLGVFFGIIVVLLVVLYLNTLSRSEQDIYINNDEEPIILPSPGTKGELSLEEAIVARRSVRVFRPDELDYAQVSQLLWAAQGITDEATGHRAAPSAGATYPLELYYIDSKGVYRYNPSENLLEPLKSGDYRSDLASAALGQNFISQAPAAIVISAVYERTTSGYGRARGERYVHIEAGHAAQNIHLQAVSLGLGSVPVGAFNDNQVKRVLSLPENNEPIYIIPVGMPN